MRSRTSPDVQDALYGLSRGCPVEPAQNPVAEAAVQLPVRHVRIVLADSEGPNAVSPATRHVWACRRGDPVARILEGLPPAQRADRVWAMELDGGGEKDLLGKNVGWDATGQVAIAQTNGHIVFERGKIRVEEKLEISGDMDASGGPITFCGPMHVRGSVLDSTHLAVEGELLVDGSIEAATVVVRGNITVRHGICGKGRGHVEASGFVDARFASNAHIKAGGDVIIAKEISNTKVVCGGTFKAERGTVIASHVIANTGIICETSGSEAGIKTTLELSSDPAELAAICKTSSDVHEIQKRVAEIRAKVEPLLRSGKELPPAQKEKTNRLMELAREAEKKVVTMIASLAGPQERIHMALAGQIRMESLVHAGSVLRCMGFETLIASAIRGPMRVSLKIGNGNALFAVLDSHGKVVGSLPVMHSPELAILAQLKAAGAVAALTPGG